MQTIFEYDGYPIVFERRFSSAHLIINGITVDSCNGFVKSQLSDFELNGSLPDGRSVRLQIRFRFLVDHATLFIDGTPVIRKNAL